MPVPQKICVHLRNLRIDFPSGLRRQGPAALPRRRSHRHTLTRILTRRYSYSLALLDHRFHGRDVRAPQKICVHLRNLRIDFLSGLRRQGPAALPWHGRLAHGRRLRRHSHSIALLDRLITRAGRPCHKQSADISTPLGLFPEAVEHFKRRLAHLQPLGFGARFNMAEAVREAVCGPLQRLFGVDIEEAA